MRKLSATERIRRFFLANIGKVVTSLKIRDAAGITSWDRRVRELREKHEWQILSNNDTTDLKPGQYLLKEAPPEQSIKFVRGMSAKLRAEILDRNGFTCQMCGLTPGDIDPMTNRKVRLHLGHIKDRSLGGKDELSNLRALCSTCNQGAKNVTSEKPTRIWLLSQIRRAGRDEQMAVPILHASISCKWTLRSDRAQNARSEALNLIRNRKGRSPHIVVVTGEPLPSRLASLALGTGDLDCIYHFALPELISGVDMVDGKRLKDISDLPLDLAV